MATNSYRVENQFHDADDLLQSSQGDGVLEAHRKRIEPWLSALFQSEHLNLLVGSGFGISLAHAANVSAASMALISIHPDFDLHIQAAAAESAARMGRGRPNIEDQLRAALALEAGLSVLRDPRHGMLKRSINQALANFGNAIVAMEKGVLDAGQRSEENQLRFERLLSEFLLSFASRTASRDRLHVFTTNYDRLLEHGFDLIAARPIDRFTGALAPRFRASRFEIDIHYTPPVGEERRGRSRVYCASQSCMDRLIG